MAGISDLPYRLLLREFGCELAFTEMISATALAYSGKNTLKMLSSHGDDRPLGIQIMGDDEETIQRALERISAYPFDILDFNAACPAAKVASKGKGAGLLRDPAKLQKLLRLLVKTSDMPVTVKIRSGWDESALNAEETALRAEEAGVRAVFIHGRSKIQGYSGAVDYGIIRKVKESLTIPVIASGDALTPLLIKKLFDETGCDGVAIARGALGNPWIFPQSLEYLTTGMTPPGPDLNELSQVMKKHLSMNVAFKGEINGVIRFRKFFGWYTSGMAVKALKRRAFQATTHDEMARLIDELRVLPAGPPSPLMRDRPVKYFQLSG